MIGEHFAGAISSFEYPLQTSRKLRDHGVRSAHTRLHVAFDNSWRVALVRQAIQSVLWEVEIDEVERSLDVDDGRVAQIENGNFSVAKHAMHPGAPVDLELAASKSGWGSPLPARTGRGVAAQGAFGSFIATVAEVEVDENGDVHVHRIVSAVDTGIVVNPDTVVAQLQGGLIFGLTAALFGEITIDKGRVQQSNFQNYRMLRINEVPKIEVHLIASGEAPGGIGETGTTAPPPAVGNAIYAATGVALRRLPIDRALIAAGRKA